MKTRSPAGGVLVDKKRRMYLVHKLSRDEWVLPKGGIEEGESALEAGNNTNFDFTFCDDNTGETLEGTIAMERDDLERIKKRIADANNQQEWIHCCERN